MAPNDAAPSYRIQISLIFRDFQRKIVPPLPFATFCIQTQRIALRLGMRGKATASPIVVMRSLTVWPNQRIGSASPLNFPLESMGSRARGQDHALMHPPAWLAHHLPAERLPNLRLPVARRPPGSMPEKYADAASLCHTLLVATYGTLHDADPSLRYLCHGGVSPVRPNPT